MLTVAPSSSGSPEKIFCDTEGLATLDDLARFVTEEEHLEAKVIDKVGELTVKGRNLSRLRMAWRGCRDALHTLDERRKRAAESSDYDRLLEPDELRVLDLNFWRRYKRRFAADQCPGDSLVSQLHRMFQSHAMIVHNVWRVKRKQLNCSRC